MSRTSNDEMALVGGIFVADDFHGGEHRDIARSVLADFPPATLSNTKLALIFTAMRAIAERGGVIDLVTVEHQLREDGTLDEVGGVQTLTELLNFPYPDRIAEYVSIVRDNAAARDRRDHERRLRSRLQTLGRRAEDGESVEELVAAAAEILEDRARAEPAVGVVTLRELLGNHDFSARPVVVIPHFAWRARTALVAGREKDGKSTTAAAALAALSAGLRFLDERLEARTVLVLSLEEHTDDTAAKLLQFGADPDRVYLLHELIDPLADLEAAIRATGAAVAVVDTLAAFTQRLELESGDAAGWTVVMRKLTAIARRTGAALILLHHARKSDGRYRDSTAIGANVDMILEMGTDPDRPTVRTFKCRGRWPADDFTAELRASTTDDLPSYFALADQALSIDAQVLAFVRSSPGASKRAIREAVRGRASDVDGAVSRLLSAREIQDRGQGNRSAFHACASPEAAATEGVDDAA